jgi:hypothetical protein
MNVELLGRQAIDIIKSKWGLPKEGFVAGGSIANIIWELVSGNKAIVNDVDIFVFDSVQANFDRSDKSSLFNYQEKETRYYEDYTGMCFNTHTKDFYSIVESTKDDIFNIIKYKSNTSDPSLIIKSFDINSTRVGYSIEKDELYWTSEFEEFLKTGELKVCNLMTPSHTAVRIAKKSKELNAKLDLFEFKLIQHALSYSFADRIKFRFKERYLEMFESNLDILEPHFIITRDNEAEEFVKTQYLEDVKLYYLMPNIKTDNDNDIFISPKIFSDSNIFSIHKSSDFLFYMRNIYGKDNLSTIWEKVYYYFNDVNYIDREVISEDLELLYRFSQAAPNSIENLKGMKISEQINTIKKFLDKFKEDPIIAISILESMKIDKDIELDEQTSLLLELSVRKKIVNDTRNKVGRILNNESVDKVSSCDDLFTF